MIVKWEDGQGESFYDYVSHVSKLYNETSVKLTRATLDGNLVGTEVTNGTLTILSDGGAVINQYILALEKG